ncbi:hypothetical protein [Enterobacter sp. R4-368]|uniref:hypothetical protein n=1 Tax=Enterobacter sp. R4-368 TaxID=1166130 RepID=UPI00034EFDDF|nr:hypothetical protein [Enterobacter sp. R4-368]AGN88268.1 hypothetical protein H650_00165 [Enterobacter sp. R4-368]
MKFSRTERWLHAFSVVAFTLLILIILFGQTVKDSGPAEWLSALLNLVMAAAAVAAYLTARSWLPQLTTQEGYKLAIHLVNNELIWLDKRNRLLSDTGSVFEVAREAFKGREISLLTRNRLVDAIARLEQTTKESRRRRDEIDNAIFRMQTYGLRVANDRQSPMADMLENHRKSLAFAGTLLAIVSKNFNNRGTSFSQEGRLFDEKRRARLAQLNSDDTAALASASVALEGLTKCWAMMVQAHREFTGEDHRIGKLFIVSKD